MNQALKALGITVLVMGVLIGTLAGMSAIIKYDNSINPPEPNDIGVCYPQYENCSGVAKSPESQEKFNQWVRSQTPSP